MTLVDTVVLIDLFEGSARRREAAGTFFSAGSLVAASELIRSEALVLPIRTGDHAATALLHEATEFVTRDPGFRRVPGLTVTVLA